MDYEKPETATFKCVVDTLNLRVSEDGHFNPEPSLSKAIQDELADVEHADKPFGALFNVNPPPPEYDQQGNVTNAPKPFTLTPHQLEASTKRSYQPLDRVNTSIGFSTHKTERNFIFLRVGIPFEQIPDTVDPKTHTADGFVVKLKFYANNMIGLDSPLSSLEESDNPNNIFTTNDDDEEVFNKYITEDIPNIVLKTPGYDRIGKNGKPKAKFGVFRLKLNVKDIASAISENLIHSTTWPAAPWAPRRVIKFLQFIMSQHTFSLPIYIMDTAGGNFQNCLIECLRGMRKELREGNPFRGYLSQNFKTNGNVPTIDSDTSIKDARSSPNIVTQKQLQYCTKEEMITRLAVGTKQQLEDRRAKIVKFRALKQAIRLVKIVDDSAYYVFFKAPQDLRLQAGDVLKVNFSPDNPIRKEDWNLTICESFDWSYQGESIGILKRPLVPLDDAATEEETNALPDSEVLEKFLSNDVSFKAAALKYKTYSEQGKKMEHEAVRELFKDLLPNAIKNARQSANVVLTTPSQTATTKFMNQFRQLHALLIDEAGLATLIDLIMLLCTLETESLVLFGDTKQLTPQAPLIKGSQGLSCETSQGIMTYFLDNHWPKASLNIQRRGCPGIMEVASELFYRKQIQDAPVAPAQFPLRDMVAHALRLIFLENTISKPYLYINAVHEGEIVDHSTKSWMNLTSAAVNVNLIEYLITKCNVPPSSMIVITHYTAQLRVYRHAISKLAIHTTDSIQGGSADITFSDPVRTQNPGFTNNPGRNCVALTRARSFQIITANTRQLKTYSRSAPIIFKAFEIAQKAKACVNISKSMDARYSNLLLHRHVHAVGGARV
ncbi:uncharacterized protein Bfra_001409 [Botrytis fragariae]|uniref:DNA2/NAM7 helicase-like C-terminal domain-containing protein n=1 Tax=Botrytis fragariae TaxID=1964551 RepID=A0A8H6B0R0_9HELO|nr:uncharacterized protein Bfra_001409 [Botrytis fragariae]KAF5877048.1 hypothetical protein Bfra_001409 [Botrytis fragariae]